jgi:hypothetical protein
VRRLFGVALGVHAGPAQIRASIGSIARRPRAGPQSTPPSPAREHRVADMSNEHHHADVRRDGDSTEMSVSAAPHRETRETAVAAAIAQIVDPHQTASRVNAEIESSPGGGEAAAEIGGTGAPIDPASVHVADESAELAHGRQQPQTRPQGEPHLAPAARAVGRATKSQPRHGSHHALSESANQLSSLLATEGVATELGGVFYLIHALRAMQLPDAFDPGWRLDATAGPWGTLDLVARAFLGTRHESADPLWDALAALAAWPQRYQRSRANPGSLSPHASQNDPRFGAPAAWREELDDDGNRFAWTSVGPRVWLWSSTGYLVSHGRTSLGSAAAARRALRQCPGVTDTTSLIRKGPDAIPWLPPSALPRGCPSRLGRWAAAVAPAVLRRVVLALEHRGANERGHVRLTARSIRPMLAVPARLYVTSSHVDVVMPLRRIDVNVRRAGLDRDPGWIPALGRVVYFPFA